MVISMMLIASNVARNTRMNLLEVRWIVGQFSYHKINIHTNTDAVFKDEIPYCKCGGVVKPG